MSNSNDSIIDLNGAYWSHFILTLNEHVTRYGMGLIWLIGNFGSISNFFIFTQANLRKNPCIMYFLASTLSQFISFNFALLTRILEFGFNVNIMNTSLWFCKIRYYFFYIFVVTSRYFIMLASIDRYFASSSDSYWRGWSSRKMAERFIFGNYVFWCLIYIQVLIHYTIRNGECSFQDGLFGMLFSIYLSIESGIVPPMIMLIFGFLTLNNIRQSKRKIRALRIASITRSTTFTGMSKKDLQFSKMLFNQICIWIVLNFLNPCYLFYRAITLNHIKSPVRLTIELFISNTSYFFIYLEFSLTFFIYTLSSPLFRNEFHQFIRKKILRRFIPPNVVRNNT